MGYGIRWFALAWTALACQPVAPTDGGLQGDVQAVDAGSTSDTSGEGAQNLDAPSYPIDNQAPVVTLLSPEQKAEFESSTAVISGLASDDVGIAALMVKVGPNMPIPVSLPDASGHFAFDVSLAPGTQEIRVQAYDIGGQMGEATVSVTRRFDARDDTAAPIVAILTPEMDFSLSGVSVPVSGTASDDVGIAAVQLAVDGGPPQDVQTDDSFATWYATATVLPNATGTNTITVIATDLTGKTSQAQVAGSTTVVADDTPPTVAIMSPQDGFSTTDDTVTVTGTASDDTAVVAVDIRVDDGPYVAVDSTDGFLTWSTVVAIPPGEHTIKVRALDPGGISATAAVQVVNTSVDQWGPPQTLQLTWSEPSYAASSFVLDRDGLDDMMTDEVADALVMLEVDVTSLVQAAIETIKEACGPAWPTVDVSQNCPTVWSASEINMYRLVTMTPANVNVAGTSISGLEDIAGVLSSFGLLDSFSEILADALDIALDDPIVQSPAIVTAMLDNVLGTHPNMLPGPKMPVTMLDALSDMTTLGAKFDASGTHPGFVDGLAGTTSKVLLDSFEMTMVATSNLHWHDGVSLGIGKAYMARLADITGPTYDDVLEFDFLSPDTFQVSGIAANPTVDLTFKLYENANWIPIGTSRFPTPKGNSPVWDLDPWELERVFAEASYQQYQNHRAGCNACTKGDGGAEPLLYEALGIDEAEIVVGRSGYDNDPLFGSPDGVPEHFPLIDPNPAGWMRIWTLFGLGSPPAPQYVWDMILEVAERRLLDGGVAQGDGDVSFPLYDIPVGMTASEIKDATRPVLESQKSKLSSLLLGDYNETAQAMDFYLAKGDDGALRLYFVNDSDPVPTGTAIHAKPGFFSDEDLTEKVSLTGDSGSGDDVHEKLSLEAPQTVYCQDGSGQRYRVQLEPASNNAVSLTVRAYVGP